MGWTPNLWHPVSRPGKKEERMKKIIRRGAFIGRCRYITLSLAKILQAIVWLWKRWISYLGRIHKRQKLWTVVIWRRRRGWNLYSLRGPDAFGKYHLEVRWLDERGYYWTKSIGVYNSLDQALLDLNKFVPEEKRR